MENNQKNAAEVETSVPDLIPSNYREKAEALGWVIDEDKVCGVFTFRQGGKPCLRSVREAHISLA